MPDVSARKLMTVMIAVLTFIAVAWALQVTLIVTMPLVFAFFLAALLHPVQAWLVARLPARIDWLALALTMTIVLAVLAGFILAGYLAVRLTADRIPEYAQRARAYIDMIREWAAAHSLPVPHEAEQSGTSPPGPSSFASRLLDDAQLVLSVLVLIFFYTLLMLAECRRWGRKIALVQGEAGRRSWRDIVEAISASVRQYLLLQTVVGVITAAVVTLWLWIMGLDFLFIWALLQFTLNYIPNVGSLIAGILPSLFALVELGAAKGLLVIAGIFLIEQVLGNYVDPLLKGRVLDISPLVVLLAVIFWGWVWGVAGAFLAVPIVATLIIAGGHIPALRPLAVLLSDSAHPETAPVGKSAAAPATITSP